MKVAISATGTDLSAMVDRRFGRAEYFIIADTETGEHHAVENVQNLNLPQGAGIQAGKTVANTGVVAVITGHLGPKAYKILDASGIIAYLGAEGTVEKALEMLKQGSLPKADGPDVDGHWV